VLLVGVIVLFTGAVQVRHARRREAAVRAPLITTGIGFVIVLAAGVTLGATGVLHTIFTFQTFSALR
jgi:hypothetical protein